MPTLTIAPLALPGGITKAAFDAVNAAPRLFLQTAQHPSANWILQSSLAFTSMDDLYESAEDFDALNSAIAERLTAGGDAVYAMPGRGPGAAQLAAIEKAAGAKGFSLWRLPSSGYSEAALCGLPLPTDRSVVCTALDMPKQFDPSALLCVEELDSRLRAGEVKLSLLEYYPDNAACWFCFLNGEGGYERRKIQLFELDRQTEYFAATVLALPPQELMTLTRFGTGELMSVMRRLREPGGCPWDAEQTHESLKSALIEETYEVLDAIDNQDMDALCEELGDLLLQIAFHTQIEQEKAAFNMRDVSTGIVSKLIYRHPHVFGEGHVSSSGEVLVKWEELKQKEKHYASKAEAMQLVPRGLPALMRAAKIQKKAASVGFDWDSPQEALAKISEEAGELARALEGDGDVFEELGDLLFSAVNVARLCKCEPEQALTQATDKFMARFALTEQLITEDGRDMKSMTLPQLDEYWDKAKLLLA